MVSYVSGLERVVLMRDNSLLTLILIIFLLIVVFGGQLGVSISGKIEQPNVSSEAPGILKVIDWAWTGVSFFFAMIAFQVPDMPFWLSSIFLIMTILLIWILAKWVRGGSAGVG